MDGKLDFIVLGAHGSGLNACHNFITQLKDVKCLYPCVSVASLTDFLNKTCQAHAGAIIDSTMPKRPGVLEAIRHSLSKDCLLIVLTRDPLARLKSVMNTHLSWWAEAVAGTYEMELGETLLYIYGSQQRLLYNLLIDSTMNAVVKLYHSLAQKCRKTLVYDISALFCGNSASTFQEISSHLRNKPLEEPLQIPESRPFSRQNLFARYVKPLFLDLVRKGARRRFTIRPCPRQFIQIYHYAEKQILLCQNPDELGFPLGHFTGEICFASAAPEDITEDEAAFLRKKLSSRPEIMRNYIDDLQRRHSFAENLFKTVRITDRKLLAWAREDADLAKVLLDFMLSQFALIDELAPGLAKEWREAVPFVHELLHSAKTGASHAGIA